MFLGFLLLLLGFPPSPGPGQGYQPGPNEPQTAEESAEYEAQYNSCAGTWDPDGCRADLAKRYGYS